MLHVRLALAALVTAIFAPAIFSPPADAHAAVPACIYEDGSGQAICVWDAKHMGNGNGKSFIAKNPRFGKETFRYISHKKAHRLLGL